MRYKSTVTKDSVLVVDDDREIRTLLCDYLEQNGYRANAVPNGKAMWAALASSHVDMVVLDLMLPGEDGLVLCREIRARMDTPVIMLTARGEEIDRIIGLEMGADDYLPKPFNPRELLARMKSVLRRSRSLPRNLQPEDARLIRFAGWTLDPALRRLTSADGVVVPLGGAEYRLLRILLNHSNRVLSRDQIMELAKGRETDPFDRSIDAQVSRLRQRLRDDPREPAIIQTVRGEGYVLSARVEVVR
jgi:two-component system OmpR family response regulator